jgi:soluble lytic murein transglycosylase-like protein
MRGSLSVYLILLAASTAHAFCYEQAGAEYGLAPEILQSISSTESGNKPYAVHYNSDGTFDVGLMQINSSWEKSVGKELWSRLFDPCTNVRMGAWILARCVKRYGYGWKAVGCYHSSTPSKRDGYAKKVAHALVRNREKREVTPANAGDMLLFSAATLKAEETTPWDTVFTPVDHVR